MIDVEDDKDEDTDGKDPNPFMIRTILREAERAGPHTAHACTKSGKAARHTMLSDN